MMQKEVLFYGRAEEWRALFFYAFQDWKELQIIPFGGGTRFENGKIRSLRIPIFGFSSQSPAMASNGKFRWLS